MVVSGGALIFARMLSCTFLRFTCFGGGVGGVGWGGLGMLTFAEVAHMLHATQLRLGCPCTRARCYASDGVGVGWGCQRSLKLRTCCMLRNCVAVARAHVLDATPVMGWGGVGMLTFAEVAHMLHATQLRLGCPCTRARCYASDGVGWGGDVNVC